MNDPSEEPRTPDSGSGLERGSATEIIEDLAFACGLGVHWMNHVRHAQLSSATRGMLTTDLGMCSNAMLRARQYLDKVKPPISEQPKNP